MTDVFPRYAELDQNKSLSCLNLLTNAKLKLSVNYKIVVLVLFRYVCLLHDSEVKVMA